MRMVICLLVVFTVVAVRAAFETSSHFIDVMLAFDKSAERWLVDNGLGSVDDFAQSKISEMNVCLANSGLTDDFTFRLVGTFVADVDTSAMKLLDVLGELQLIDGSGTGRKLKAAYQAVHDRRDALGADLFSFITGGNIQNDQRGLGYTLVDNGASADNMAMFGFNACSVQAVASSGDYTLIHEFGHNMGCGHADGIDDANWQGWASYSRGMNFTGNTRSWVSIMGYGNWVPYFSSPDVYCDGVPTGDATHDNVRTLRETYQFVARYRTSKSGPSDSPSSTDGFNPSKAATWFGAVYDEKDEPIGLVQLKVGKASRAGESKVTATVIGLDGRKYASKAVKVKTGGTAEGKFEVKDMGQLELSLDAKGFSGMLGGFKVISIEDSAVTTIGKATFKETDLSSVQDVLKVHLPAGEEVNRMETKWTVVAKPGKLKYVKPNPNKGITGGLQATGGNISGLKLSYSAKTLTFKGSFKIWTFDAEKRKLKSVSAAVTGIVVNGVGYGQVTVKKMNVGVITVE